jgi:signal transduction histidine kinase
VADWVARVAHLEQRLLVRVIAGPDITIRADADQLDQLLINILRNAVDATIERNGEARAGVSIEWREQHGNLEVLVEDEGHGIANTANLFVPFFTTKPGGSGIGLFLSRQIAEAHAGTVALKNRVPGPGCRAVITLPL